MKKSKNLDFYLPERTDAYNVENFNRNYEKLDSIIGNTETIIVDGFTQEKNIANLIIHFGKNLKEIKDELSGAVAIINDINDGL